MVQGELSFKSIVNGRQRTKTDHKSSPCHYVTGELSHKLILEFVLQLKKCHFTSLETILNCQAEYPLKTYISVEKLNEGLIQKPCLISKFCSQYLETESLIQLVYAMKELDW